MFSNGKTFTKKYSIFAINVVYIWETLLLDQHVSVAEWSKAPANHSRDQGGVGSIPSPAKNFFFEFNFLFSPRVSRCVQFLFVLSGRELKEVVIFSFSTHADLHCTLTNIWIFVQSNLNTQINLVLKDKTYAVWWGKYICHVVILF